ncbi:MAG TPA: carbohydrate binding family 9 domain-containing protein, partial [Gemmatimonadaceae bacterium]
MSFAGLTALLLAALQASPPQQQGGPLPTADAIAADTGAMRHANHRTPPLVYAQRITTGSSVRLDGRLDEAIWSQARPAGQFSQSQPLEGQPATERTDVRVLYDEHAVYIGAKLFDSDPAGIRSQLARRDAFTEADRFEVALDSYHDHNTSFVFGVNPSGTKSDRVVGSDGFSSDDGWDPVWQATTHIDEDGWTVELRIPLSQLRFSTAARQVWGINFFRRVQRKAEQDVFAYSNPSDRGFASFFAHLYGIERLPRSRRLELVPYA